MTGRAAEKTRLEWGIRGDVVSPIAVDRSRIVVCVAKWLQSIQFRGAHPGQRIITLRVRPSSMWGFIGGARAPL